jgi:superfamily II DNA or RNA helicase
MNVQLKEHQQFVVDYLKENRSLLIYHSTGSGKTLTALHSVLRFPNKIIIIGPKSSRKAFFDEIEKMGIKNKEYEFKSFKKIKNILGKKFDYLADSSVIIDEAHNIRNETKDNLLLMVALESAFRILLLTATPCVNYPNDLAVLINIVKGIDILPTDRHLFNTMYYDEEKRELKNMDIFSKKIKNTLSFYSNKQTSDYPVSKTIWKKIQMNQIQMDEYSMYVAKIFKDEKIKELGKITKDELREMLNVDIHTVEKRKMNFFLSGTRQVSNTVNGDSSFPKIIAIYEEIKKGPFPVVVYSNFLKNGIYCFIEILEKDSIPYKMIKGSTNEEKINIIVNQFNKGKIKVLLLSSAGSESLDLKNTRQLHIMEPHWNESRITQVIGRVIRYKSHNQLPENERNVIVYRWTSTFPEKITKNKSADEYLAELSEMKKKMFGLYDKCIVDASIEKNWNVNQKGGNNYYCSYLENKKIYTSLKNFN